VCLCVCVCACVCTRAHACVCMQARSNPEDTNNYFQVSRCLRISNILHIFGSIIQISKAHDSTDLELIKLSREYLEFCLCPANVLGHIFPLLYTLSWFDVSV